MALALVIGIAGGSVLFGIAGMRRSSSALERFFGDANTSDASVSVNRGDPDAGFAAVAALPGVAAAHRVKYIPAGDDERRRIILRTSPDANYGVDVDAVRILAGRQARAADEITVNEAASDRLGVKVGDRLTVRTLAPAALDEFVNGRLPRDIAFDGPRSSFAVVGIHRTPESLDPSDVATGVPGPGFYERSGHDALGFDRAMAVELEAGVDAARFTRSAAAALPRGTPLLVEAIRDDLRDTVGAGVRVIVIGLAIFSGLALVAGGLVVAQSLARHMAASHHDQVTLQALGLGRADRTAVLVLTALPAVVAGAVLASLAAVAASPLAEFGIARRAEPHPGVAVDWLVHAGGVGVVMVAVLAAAVALAWRHAAVRAVVARPVHRGRLGAAPTNAPVPLQLGSWLAFARSPSVPTRSVAVALVVAVSGIVGATVFTVTAHGHTGGPAAWGWVWDLEPEPRPTAGRAALDRLPRDGVDAAAIRARHSVEVDRHQTGAVSFRPVVGEVGPPILAGRAPRTATEVALGRLTLRESGLGIGDHVKISWAGGQDGEEDDLPAGTAPPTIDATIVGETLVALGEFDLNGTGYGALLTPEGFESLMGPGASRPGTTSAVVTIPMVLHDRGRIAVTRAELEDRGFMFNESSLPVRPDGVGHLSGALGVPIALIVLFSALGLVCLLHALSVSTRRRRRFFGVLASLGCVRAQLRGTVLAQGVLLATGAVVVGVPLGLVLGTRVWSAVADTLGLDADAEGMPASAALATLAILAVGAIGSALIALYSFRRAPTDALRSE